MRRSPWISPPALLRTASARRRPLWPSPPPRRARRGPPPRATGTRLFTPSPPRPRTPRTTATTSAEAARPSSATAPAPRPGAGTVPRPPAPTGTPEATRTGSRPGPGRASPRQPAEPPRRGPLGADTHHPAEAPRGSAPHRAVAATWPPRSGTAPQTAASRAAAPHLRGTAGRPPGSTLASAPDSGAKKVADLIRCAHPHIFSADNVDPALAAASCSKTERRALRAALDEVLISPDGTLLTANTLVRVQAPHPQGASHR
mmetsp:Transcript_30778/g.77856  ORF Transcript_30778/g.77856 Transcript_30778/m.77856 type:complete len:259 (-) Transcript_30778:2106-2882(-)